MQWNASHSFLQKQHPRINMAAVRLISGPCGKVRKSWGPKIHIVLLLCLNCYRSGFNGHILLAVGLPIFKYPHSTLKCSSSLSLTRTNCLSKKTLFVSYIYDQRKYYSITLIVPFIYHYNNKLREKDSISLEASPSFYILLLQLQLVCWFCCVRCGSSVSYCHASWDSILFYGQFSRKQTHHCKK